MPVEKLRPWHEYPRKTQDCNRTIETTVATTETALNQKQQSGGCASKNDERQGDLKESFHSCAFFGSFFYCCASLITYPSWWQTQALPREPLMRISRSILSPRELEDRGRLAGAPPLDLQAWDCCISTNL